MEASSLGGEKGGRGSYFDRPDNYLAKNHFVRIRADIIGDVVRPLNPRTILDVGCGDGGISIPLLTAGRRLTLVDSSSPMLERARRSVPAEYTGAVECREAALQNLTDAGPYDLVLAIGLLAHVPSVPEALDRLAALTAPGGHLVVQLTDYDSLIGRFNYEYFRLRERISPMYGYSLNRLSSTGLAASGAARNMRLSGKTRYSVFLPGMSRIPNGMLYALARASRSWPLKELGGESILIFEKPPGAAA